MLKKFLKNTDNKKLTLLIWVSLGAVLLISGAFGIYYYQDRYLHLGDVPPVEQGIAELEQAIREDPGNPDLRVALAEHYLQNGQYFDAIEQADMVLAIYPDSEGALYVAGLAYVRSGQTEAAIEPLEKFTDIRREGPMAHVDDFLETALYFLGESYNKLGRPEEAIPVLEEAIAINFSDADALYQLGVAYSATGEHEKALEQYHRAVEFVPDFTEAYQGMAESYGVLGQLDHVQYAQGMVAFCQKDYVTAREKLEPAAAALPNFAPVHLGLGLAYEQVGEIEMAVRELNLALQLNPSDFMSLNALDRIEHSQNGN